MTRKLISSGSKFEEIGRYSRAVVDDDWVVVSGTIGVHPVTGELPESAEEQARNSFAIIEQALAQGQASLADVIRCGVYIVDAADVPAVMRVLAEKFAVIRPANTTIICQLPAPGAKVEIEVMARRRSRAGSVSERRHGTQPF
jgi:enamine deaminase RidA (YjgF/YER057c/UK114 family)